LNKSSIKTQSQAYTIGIVLAGLLVFISSCATYYEKSLLFQEQFVQGKFEDARKTLDKNKRAAKDKNRLLYFFQKGVVLQMLENYSESNESFEEAYIFSEDFQKSYARQAASILSNPTTMVYAGEDHELVLMHYFKALNFLRMNQFDEALVECRRINNKLNLLNDRYEKKKNRYRRDAFALNLMGIAYEASGDVNNAFIAYRNAYEAYDEDYKVYFGTEVPEQLKKDLLRTAYMNGFKEELEKFEGKFSMKYVHEEKAGGELVFFWHNGLGPVKDEWSVNFFLLKAKEDLLCLKMRNWDLAFLSQHPLMDKAPKASAI